MNSIFGFAEYRENVTFGLGNILTLIGNIQDAFLLGQLLKPTNKLL